MSLWQAHSQVFLQGCRCFTLADLPGSTQADRDTQVSPPAPSDCCGPCFPFAWQPISWQ